MPPRRSSWRATRFARVLGLYVDHLEAHNPVALDELGLRGASAPARAGAADPRRERLLDLLRLLANNPLERVAHAESAYRDLAGAARAAARVRRRSLRLLAPLGPLPRGERRDAAGPRGQAAAARASATPSRRLRAWCARCTGTSPRTSPGAGRACTARSRPAPRWASTPCRRSGPRPARYRELLAGIPFVRNLLMYPPLLLDPPANTRTGQFAEVTDDPLDGLALERERWLCYPALVGRLVVFVYFHQRFAGLGLALANLFEVASDEEIAAGPDAVYLYGVPPAALRPLRRAAHRVPPRRRQPSVRGGGAVGGPLRLLRLPQEDGAHSAQRGRHGPRADAVPRGLHAPRARRRQRGQRPHHRRHGHRQVGDAGGAAHRRRRAHPRGARDRRRHGIARGGRRRPPAGLRHRDRRLRAPRRPAAGVRLRAAGPRHHHEPEPRQRARRAAGRRARGRAARLSGGLPPVRQQLRAGGRRTSGAAAVRRTRRRRWPCSRRAPP